MTTKEHIKALEDERKVLISHIEELESDPERHYIRMRETIQYERELRQKAEARAADLAGVLGKAEAWMASEDGPIYRLWEDTDICNYDNRECEWEETLAEVRNFNIPADCLGYGTEWAAVKLYREVLAALNPDARQEGEAE